MENNIIILKKTTNKYIKHIFYHKNMIQWKIIPY